MTSSPRSRAGWGSISHERRASLSLHGFPCEAVDQIERDVARGVRKVLYVAPTGSGKTVVAAENGQDGKELHK